MQPVDSSHALTVQTHTHAQAHTRSPSVKVYGHNQCKQTCFFCNISIAACSCCDTPPPLDPPNHDDMAVKLVAVRSKREQDPWGQRRGLVTYNVIVLLLCTIFVVRLSIWYLFFSCKPCRRQHSAGCHARQFKIRVFEALRSPTRPGTSQLGHLPEKRERIPLGSFSLSREYTCCSREHLRSAVSTRVNWSELCGIISENVRLCRCVVALE